jgi:hypothetical protein
MVGHLRLAGFCRRVAHDRFTDSATWGDVNAAARLLLVAHYLEHALDTETQLMLDHVITGSERCDETRRLLRAWSEQALEPATLSALVDAIVRAELSATIDTDLATLAR